MDDLFGNLFNLRELNLSSNNIKTICPTVQLLQKLTVLNLSYNLIDEIPRTISQLMGLQHLLLHQNNLKTISSEIGTLEHLVVLNLSNNEIVEIPDTISKLTALSKVSSNFINFIINELTMIP
jgi:Leucine-rich repeat (LRR) protein